MEDAKTEADFKDAANEFSQAVNIAPWLGNGYRDLAIAADKSADYDRALRDLGWYLLSKPAPADVNFAEDLKAKIEYRKEKAAKEAQAATQKAVRKNDRRRLNDKRRTNLTLKELGQRIQANGPRGKAT